MVRIPPNGGFPQLQAFSNDAFPFTVVILIVIMISLIVQIVLAIKMQCLAKRVMAIHQSCELWAIHRPATVITRQDKVGNSRYLFDEPLFSPHQELLVKSMFAISFLFLWWACSCKGEVLVAHNNTAYITLETIPAVGWVTANQISWAGPAVVSLSSLAFWSNKFVIQQNRFCRNFLLTEERGSGPKFLRTRVDADRKQHHKAYN